jgi:hypothetical protein
MYPLVLAQYVNEKPASFSHGYISNECHLFTSFITIHAYVSYFLLKVSLRKTSGYLLPLVKIGGDRKLTSILPLDEKKGQRRLKGPYGSIAGLTLLLQFRDIRASSDDVK